MARQFKSVKYKIELDQRHWSLFAAYYLRISLLPPHTILETWINNKEFKVEVYKNLLQIYILF